MSGEPTVNSITTYGVGETHAEAYARGQRDRDAEWVERLHSIWDTLHMNYAARNEPSPPMNWDFPIPELLDEMGREPLPPNQGQAKAIG